LDRARTAIADGDLQLAESLLRAAIDLSPNDHSLKAQLGDVLLTQGKPALVLRLLEPHVQRDEPDFDCLVVAGRAALALKSPTGLESSAEYWTRALEINPDDELLTSMLGLLLLTESDSPQRARDATARLANRLMNENRISPIGVFVLEIFGEASLRLGPLADARRVFMVVKRVEPTNDSACESLAKIAILEGKHREAIEHLEGAVKKTATYFRLLGVARAGLKETKQAVEALSESVALEPKNLETLRFLAAACQIDENYDRALEACGKGLAIDDGALDLHRVKIDALEAKSSWLEVLAAIEAAESAGLQKGEADSGRGHALLRLDRPQEAVLYLRSAISSQPENLEVNVTLLAIALDRSGNWNEAAEQYRRLEQLAPQKRAEWLTQRANCYSSEGQRLDDGGNNAAAIEMYKLAVATSPNDLNRKRVVISLARRCNMLMLSHLWQQARAVCRDLSAYDSARAAEMFVEINEGERLFSR